MNASAVNPDKERTPPLLVVTDLDGTLLDHFSYSFAKALPALTTLREQQIPLIPNTSKTAAELKPLLEKLQSNGPFIVENGSAIFIPAETFPEMQSSSGKQEQFKVVELGVPYEKIIELLTPLKSRFRFTGFNDMTSADIVDVTGLSETEAALARQRQYSEPLLWNDSQANKQAFIVEIEDQGLQTLQGGRFLHVLGKTDKGKAMSELQKIYEQYYDANIPTLALGDSGNDTAMLEAADLPVIIRNPTHEPPELQTSNPIMVSEEFGPGGWNQCVLEKLDQVTRHTGASNNG